jgi:hypothetical protein
MIGSQNIPAVPAAPLADAPRDVGNPADEQSNVTPEEQAEYDKFVTNGHEIIYPANAEGQVDPKIMEHLHGQFDEQATQLFAEAQPAFTPGSPVENLAGTLTLLVIALESSAGSAGKQLDPAVVYHGGSELLLELDEISAAAKMHDYSQKELDGAAYRAVDLWRVGSPNANPEEMAGEFEQIKQADQQGNLGQLLPGIDQAQQEA